MITLAVMESSAIGPHAAREQFAALIAQGGSVPLDEAAFLISAVILRRESIDVVEQMSRLDELAAAVPTPTIQGIAQFLFSGAEAFVGNRAEYYDPDNSLLTRVLDRHAGIPISLSVIMMEVSRRLGVDVVGIGMPGHFLTGLASRDGSIPELFVDPFHEGRITDENGCRALFHSLAGPQQTFQRIFLFPAPPMAIVERMLNNLKAIYISHSNWGAVRSVMSLRACFPGLGKSEHDEFLRLMAPLN